VRPQRSAILAISFARFVHREETLTNRHILLRELLQAQQLTRSKLNAAIAEGKLICATGESRRGYSALDEARSNELYLLGKTQRVTQTLCRSNAAGSLEPQRIFRLSIREYVIREIEAERRTLAR